MSFTPLLLFPLLATPQENAHPEAEALLDRRETTLGTPEARSAVRGLVIEGHMDVEMKDMAITAQFEELHRPDPAGERVLFTLRMEGWGETTQGTDGRVSWSTDPGFGIMVRGGVEQGPVRRTWAAQRSTPWRTLYASAKNLGPVERDGRALWELDMRPLVPGTKDQDAQPERWFLDRETNELARLAVVYPGPTGELLPMEFALSEWKPVDGILYPHRRVQEVMDWSQGEAGALMQLAYTCDSIRHEALKPERLAPPTDVAEAIADASKRAPRPPTDGEVCAIETVSPQYVATVRLEIDATKVSETLAVTLTEVVRAITEQGAEMAGPPFSRYHSIDAKNNRIDLEAGIPVKAPIEASGRVKPGELPGGRAAMTWHVGSYHQLQKSYDRLESWIAEQKLEPSGGFWEIYWTDPGLEPDPSTWRTQIFWPVE